MSRLLFSDCTPGNDGTNLPDDLDLNEGRSQYDPVMSAKVMDGNLGTKNQSQPLEFPPMSELPADSVVCEQREGMVNERCLAELSLQIKRLRGGIAGSEDDNTEAGMDGIAINAISHEGRTAAQGRVISTKQYRWSKGASVYNGSRSVESLKSDKEK